MGWGWLPSMHYKSHDGGSASREGGGLPTGVRESASTTLVELRQRVVHILLECFLVCKLFYTSPTQDLRYSPVIFDKILRLDKLYLSNKDLP